MRCFHRYAVAAVLTILSAASLSAQVEPAPDSAKIGRLATVTVTAESGNWFTRADDARRSMIEGIAENRRLVDVLRTYDAQVAQLTVRLDSLRREEFVKTVAVNALGDSVAATRARRLALEARVIALETRAPQP